MIVKRMTQLMVIGALFGAIIFAVDHAMDKGVAWYAKVALVAVMICVAIGEYLAWHNAATNYHERNAGSMALWGLLGAALTVGVFYTNFASTAANNDNKAGVQKTAFVTYDDLGKSEIEATKKVSRLEERVKMAPTRTPDAARAAIERAKADRFWKSTNGCTVTKGPQTRAFCDAYASAVADESMATTALTDREELKLAQAELKAIRDQRAAAPAVVSDDQAHIPILANFLHVDQRSARTIDGMVIPIMTQAMLLLGGILTANEAFRGKERLPWVDRAKWARRRRAIAGMFTDRRPDDEPTITKPEPMTIPQAPIQPREITRSVGIHKATLGEIARLRAA